MEFLLNVFFETLIGYGYNIFYNKNAYGNFYELRLNQLPVELECRLINNAKYTWIDDNNNVITEMCCIPSMENQTRFLKVVLNPEDYARKINIIDEVIKEYRRDISKYNP